MPQSVFTCMNTCAIDQVSSANTFPNAGDVGAYLLSGAKAVLRRALATFNVLGPASAGRALFASDTVVLAELVGYVNSVNGSQFQVDTDRVSRDNYIAAEATWNSYRTAAAWSVAGGDVSPPPATASFTSPGTLGDQVLQHNLAAFVTDAMSSRGGLVVLRWKAANESPGVTAIYTTVANPSATPPLRLRVTYLSSEPAAIDDPGEAAMHGASPARSSPPAREGRAAMPARAETSARHCWSPAHQLRPAPIANRHEPITAGLVDRRQPADINSAPTSARSHP